jgi:hypothetical protein
MLFQFQKICWQVKLNKKSRYFLLYYESCWPKQFIYYEEIARQDNLLKSMSLGLFGVLTYSPLPRNYPRYMAQP